MSPCRVLLCNIAHDRFDLIDDGCGPAGHLFAADVPGPPVVPGRAQNTEALAKADHLRLGLFADLL
ncbi:MAG: hypothetical protein DCC49_07110 [Acidobacteria bacterium]|nr:MAG: hypothetical protein DCC49_07110 [Acidobacteriota bacterium]